MPDAMSLLRASLRDPPVAGDVGLLLDLWRQVDFRIVCRRPADLEEHPDLPVRMRGAFGQALMTMPAPVSHRFDPFGRPRPLDIFFGDFTGFGGGVLPRPFVIGADVLGDHVLVRLTVFGEAAFWAVQARDAMIAALTGGISIRAEGRMRVVFDPIEIESEVVDGLSAPQAERDVTLLLKSPLVIRANRSARFGAIPLANSLLARAEGLARWQGVALSVDRGEVRHSAEALRVHTDDLYPVRFQRHSKRQEGREIPVLGLLGRIGLNGPLAPLMPFLAIGSVAHTGSHAGLGLGRYDVAAYG